MSDSQFIIENLEQLAAQLKQVAALAIELPGEEGSLAEDTDFARQLSSLQIDLLGARALAARAGADESLWRVVAIRNAQIRSTAAGLVISALGYQALPNPEPLLIDNEGPIGHHRALQLMLSLAGYFGAADASTAGAADAQTATQIGDNWGDGGFADRDAIARRIFTDTFGGP